MDIRAKIFFSIKLILNENALIFLSKDTEQDNLEITRDIFMMDST